MKIFLGGTCNGSTWRDELIPNLTIPYFNPVVPDWTPEAQKQEFIERETCPFLLYTITPKMTGVYSIAEVIDDSNKRPHRTLFCVLPEDDGATFSTAQIKSLEAVKTMVIANKGRAFGSLSDVANYVNTKKIIPEDDVILTMLFKEIDNGKKDVLEHFDLPPINLPFVIDERELNTLAVPCPDCGIELDDLRGKITNSFGTMELDMQGFCSECAKSKKVRMRWHKEGHWSVFHQGEWLFLQHYKGSSIIKCLLNIKSKVKSIYSK